MTRILWCGGSHLANARAAIEAEMAARGWQHEYFITAGPQIRNALLRGRRFAVNKNTITRPGPEEIANIGKQPIPVSHERSAAYRQADHIVFLGQWVNPHDISEQDADLRQRPISTPLLRAMVNGLIARPFDFPGGTRRSWPNQPLLALGRRRPGRVHLMLTPRPHRPALGPLPGGMMARVHSLLDEELRHRGITPHFQPPETLDADGLTDTRWLRFPDTTDDHHMSDAFWAGWIADLCDRIA